MPVEGSLGLKCCSVHDDEILYSQIDVHVHGQGFIWGGGGGGFLPESQVSNS